MKKVMCLLAVAGLVFFYGCDSKKTGETTPAEDATSATDIAETTASPIDSVGVQPDSVGILPDSLKVIDSLTNK